MAAVTTCENDLLSRTHRHGNSVHQTLSANRAGAMFSVCERLGLPRAAAVHTIRIAFHGGLKSYRYSVNLFLNDIYYQGELIIVGSRAEFY